MSASRSRLLIALLLPIVALRVLLPAGFMPVAEAGALRIVMCSEGLQLPADSPLDTGSTDSGEHPAPQDHSSCPFAHATFNVPPVQYATLTIAQPPLFQFLSADYSNLPPATGPPRSAAARAPPTLS